MDDLNLADVPNRHFLLIQASLVDPGRASRGVKPALIQ
jgi:hypothetical protein